MNFCRLMAMAAGILWVLSTAPAQAQRVIFATSVSGNANLGSWADAGGQTGVAAGDAICQARAAVAGLDNPQNFVAWLSDSSADAYCRLHGLNSTKAANCGETQLPAAAGPWVRTDGFPFGEDISQLLRPPGIVYAPVRLDEFGVALAEPPFLAGAVPRDFFTATSRRGDLQGNTCSDWQGTPSEFVVLGSSYSTTDAWSNGSSADCPEDSHLLCLERFPGPALPDATMAGKIAFVSTATGPGDLGSWPEANPGTMGLEAGDSICQNLAAQAEFDRPGLFKAWLSDSSSDAIDRVDGGGPWVRPDGFLIAGSTADLTDGTLNTSINVTETGEYLTGLRAWTGTTDLGVAHGESCQDWTDSTASSNGRDGTTNSAGFGWSGARPEVGAGGISPAGCDTNSYRLYCFSNDDSIFGNGFEGGSR